MQRKKTNRNISCEIWALNTEFKMRELVGVSVIQDYDWRGHIDYILYGDLRRKQTLKNHFLKGVQENALFLFT